MYNAYLRNIIMCFFYFSHYNNWARDATAITAWAFESNLVPSNLETINNNNFYWNVLRSSTPWLIDFYAPWCNHCHMFRPKIEHVAKVSPFSFTVN